MKRAMALDIGDARIGVALSDPLKITAQPFGIIERSSKCAQEILNTAEANDVDTIVIGLPLELNGERGPQSEKVEELVGHIRSALERRRGQDKIKIVYWDERMSTVEAKHILAGSKLKNRETREALDKIAATLMLEGYLEGLSY